jgi:hypothetical protein
MKTITRVLWIACLAFVLVGCGAPKAKTPAEAVENLRDSVNESDREQFVACFDVSESQAETLGAAFDAMQAADALNVQMVESFGPEGLEKFREDLPMLSMMIDGSSHMFDEAKTADLSTLEFVEDGDTATATGPDGQTFELVKVDGGWKLPMPGMPGGHRGTDMMESMTELLNGMTVEAREDGMTIEKFEETFVNRMMDMMEEMMQERGMGPGMGGPGMMP